MPEWLCLRLAQTKKSAQYVENSTRNSAVSANPRKSQVERRLDELRLASKPACEEVKQNVEKAWRSLSIAADKASDRFQ